MSELGNCGLHRFLYLISTHSSQLYFYASSIRRHTVWHARCVPLLGSWLCLRRWSWLSIRHKVGGLISAVCPNGKVSLSGTLTPKKFSMDRQLHFHGCVIVWLWRWMSGKLCFVCYTHKLQTEIRLHTIKWTCQNGPIRVDKAAILG